MDFFAIVGGHQQAVYRLNLERDLQDRLSRRFLEQAQEFLSDNLVAIPFKRENFKPDETEILEIAPYDLPELIFDPVANAAGWPVLPRDDDILGRVFAVFGSVPESDTVIFQVIPRTQRLTNSSFGIILSRDTFTRLESPGLVLGNSAHAVLNAGSLRFRSLWWLKQVLDISSYYQEATDADIERLATMQCISVRDVEALKEQSGQWVRTRVAYILDSGVLAQCAVPDLCARASGFGLELQTVREGEVDKLVLPEDRKSLRSVLKFLEEEYYEGPITGAAYEANSKRRI